WLEFAQTDANAQATIDRVLKRPEFELYDIQKDPWELENLAYNPEYAQVVAEMHAQLEADMERMGDEFSFYDVKQAKLEKKQADGSKKKKKKKK
ncbi:MAG: sulfatase/phosphatase domain-containing protein, partial [Coraliomargarita sp.]